MAKICLRTLSINHDKKDHDWPRSKPNNRTEPCWSSLKLTLFQLAARSIHRMDFCEQKLGIKGGSLGIDG